MKSLRHCLSYVPEVLVSVASAKCRDEASFPSNDPMIKTCRSLKSGSPETFKSRCASSQHTASGHPHSSQRCRSSPLTTRRLTETARFLSPENTTCVGLIRAAHGSQEDGRCDLQMLDPDAGQQFGFDGGEEPPVLQQTNHGFSELPAPAIMRAICGPSGRQMPSERVSNPIWCAASIASSSVRNEQGS